LLRRLRYHETVIQERYATRLAALDSVLDELAEFSPSFIHAWLREPKAGLDGLSPREVLGQGRWEEVLQHAHMSFAGLPPDASPSLAAY
jgi:hypothetical protein